MTKIVALSRSAHLNVGIFQDQVDEKIADLHMVPVVTSEWLKLAAHFPIIFAK